MTREEIVLAIEVGDDVWKCRLCGESIVEHSLAQSTARVRAHLRDGHFVAGGIKLAFIKPGD